MNIPDSQQITTWLGWAALLWRVNGIYYVVRRGRDQHRVMWRYATRKAGLPETADPIDVDAALAIRHQQQKAQHATAGKTH